MLPKYIKEDFSAYLSPVILISRKVMKIQVTIDFRHLNVRIIKNNLAYPLLKVHFQCYAILDLGYYQFYI